MRGSRDGFYRASGKAQEAPVATAATVARLPMMVVAAETRSPISTGVDLAAGVPAPSGESPGTVWR